MNSALAIRAEAEQIGGSVAGAEALVRQSLAEAERVGDTQSLAPITYQLAACRVLTRMRPERGHCSSGHGTLAGGDAAITDRLRPLLADLVEALVRTGELVPGRRGCLAAMRAPAPRRPHVRPPR